MNYFFKVFQQTGFQILGKIVTSISTFLILGMVTRTYGRMGTGIFTLSLTYLAMFYLLADFGFNAHVLRNFKSQISNVKYEWRKLLGTRIIWSGILVVVAVGLLPLWPFTSQQFKQAVLFGSLAIIASAIYTSANLIFQQRLRYDLSVIASTVGTLTGLTIYFYFIFFKFPIPDLLIAHLFGWLIISVASLLLVKKLLGKVAPIYNYQYTKSLFLDSWPIAATLALNVVYFRADSFLIAYFKGVSDVGIYNVAYSVFQSALVLPTFIMNSYYPIMLKSLKDLRKVLLGLLALASLVTIATLILAPAIIRILTGGGFSESIQSLQILSLSFPAFFLSSLLMWLLVSQGRYKKLLLIYTSGLLINLVLNFIYIPKFSFIAASWTTVISEYLILIMQFSVLFIG